MVPSKLPLASNGQPSFQASCEVHVTKTTTFTVYTDPNTIKPERPKTSRTSGVFVINNG